MADNDATIEDPDEAGAFDDWIEIYNPGTQPIDLSGMSLTDDLTEPTQWQFADGTSIAAGGYLVIWADSDPEQGNTHASFKLSSGGESIGLYHTDGQTLIDSVEFDAQETDVSYGRSPDGNATFVSMTIATPGATNGAVAAVPGDFDADSQLTAADIDLLTAAIDAQSNASEFDINGDGAVDSEDRAYWVTTIVGTNIGDADLDGTVQFSDFLTLSTNFGLSGAWAEGDFDGNGRVEFLDFLLLSQNFGTAQAAKPSVALSEFIVEDDDESIATRKDALTQGAG